MSKRNIKNSIQTLAYFLVVASFVAGCGGSEGEADSGDTMIIETDNGPVEVASHSGSATMISGSSAAIPDNFPKDVPVYTGFKPNTGWDSSNPNEFAFMGDVDATPNEVHAYYKKNAAAKGWTEVMSVTEEPTLMLSFTKDTRSLMVTATAENNGTAMSINVTPMQ